MTSDLVIVGPVLTGGTHPGLVVKERLTRCYAHRETRITARTSRHPVEEQFVGHVTMINGVWPKHTHQSLTREPQLGHSMMFSVASLGGWLQGSHGHNLHSQWIM